MPLHPRDKANAYAVGMLSETIKLAIINLESRMPTKIEDTLFLLKESLASFEERSKHYAETTNAAGEFVVPLSAS